MTKTTMENELFNHAVTLSRIEQRISQVWWHHLHGRDQTVSKMLDEMRTMIADFRDARK